MNVTLTMQFGSLSEMQSFLAANPEAATAKVASAQPSVAAAPAPAPQQAQVVQMPGAAAPAPQAAPASSELDLPALRASLMDRIRNLADSMSDPAPVAQLITSFGVQRFSDLPDDQLQIFETNLKAQFPDA